MRTLTARDLDRLEEFLCGLGEDSMLLSELDGFLAGVVVCPDLVAPSEWLPAVWGGEGPVFADAGEANEILQLIMGRYNTVARGLMRAGKYAPLLDRDTDETFLWEPWAQGFAKALDLRPEAWSLYDDGANDVTVSAFRCLAGLAFTAADDRRLDAPLDRELREEAPTLIADCLQALNAARLAQHAETRSRQTAPAVGRNDPCPCGSGKKFKKCCLS
jgi:uncharacterized protein